MNDIVRAKTFSAREIAQWAKDHGDAEYVPEADHIAVVKELKASLLTMEADHSIALAQARESRLAFGKYQFNAGVEQGQRNALAHPEKCGGSREGLYALVRADERLGAVARVTVMQVFQALPPVVQSVIEAAIKGGSDGQH
jgi:hypothetical protein